MKTWQCACGVENSITSKACSSCRAAMPRSEVTRICAEVKALLAPEIRRLKVLRAENRLKKQETSLKKCRGVFLALQIICVAAAAGFLWYTGEYVSILVKLGHTGKLVMEHGGEHIGGLRAIATALGQTATEVTEETRELWQQLLSRLERVGHISKALKETWETRPRLHAQHPEEFAEIRVNLQRVWYRIHELKESVVSYAESVIGKYR